MLLTDNFDSTGEDIDLSYGWNRSNGFRLTTENVERLKLSVSYEKSPITTQHAVCTVLLLNHNFIELDTIGVLKMTSKIEQSNRNL